MHEAWNAWIRSCERPLPDFAKLCREVRMLSIAGDLAQRKFLVRNLQPYRVESVSGHTQGLLTSYYEPIVEASSVQTTQFKVPLYRTPSGLDSSKPWYTRQEIETLPKVRRRLESLIIAWVADPVDELIVQMQGSGRLRIAEPNGKTNQVRIAYAASNNHPHKNVGSWLLERGEIRSASWQSIKDWVAANPERVNEMMWSNPRFVFYRVEAMTPLDAAFGPRGALGVALTPGRSIAVDKKSVPYGAPVWMASRGKAANLQKLVFAQDTGSAIEGPVRADYFAGWHDEAGELASRIRQPLRLWVLWPK